MEFIDKTLGGIIGDLAVSRPDATAFQFADRDYTRTWKEFDEESTLIAKGFMALGVEKGEKISMWATNTPEWMLTLFAAAKIGAVFVTVNTNYKSFELEYLLTQSDTKLLVMMCGFKDSNYVEIVEGLLPELRTAEDGFVRNERMPVLERVIFSGTGEVPKGFFDFEKLRELGSTVSDEDYYARYNGLDVHDIVNMQYTSGTTEIGRAHV